MSSTVAELRARLEQAKQKRMAELAARSAAQTEPVIASNEKDRHISPGADAVSVAPTVSTGAAAPSSSSPALNACAAPVIVESAPRVDDGKITPDFSKRSRRGNPPSVVREPLTHRRLSASDIVLGALKPRLHGVIPPASPVLLRAKGRGRRGDLDDDSLDEGGASSASSTESGTRSVERRVVVEKPQQPSACTSAPLQKQPPPCDPFPTNDVALPLRLLPDDADARVVDDVLPSARATRSATEFSRTRRISEGVYGVVYEGADILTQKPYALKWIKDRWFVESRVGFPDYLLREIDIMARVRHPNIVHGICMATCRVAKPRADAAAPKAVEGEAPVFNGTASSNAPALSVNPLVKVVVGVQGSRPNALANEPMPATDTLLSGIEPYEALSMKLFLVAEYSGATLRNEIYRQREPLNISSIKWLLGQLLRAMRFLHRRHVFHRDLKPSNILVDDSAIVKVCDMGLARTVRPAERNLTTNVVTLMYRPPELHFGIRTYEASVDMWSIGCIAAEMLLRQPLFPCTEDSKHIATVCEVMGAPTDESVYPQMLHFNAAAELLSSVRVSREAANTDGSCYGVPDTLSLSVGSHPFVPCLRLRKHLFEARSDLDCADGRALVDLIDHMLQWSPRARYTADEALRHEFFTLGVDADPDHILRRRDAYNAERLRLRQEHSAAKKHRHEAPAAEEEGAVVHSLALVGEAADETPDKHSSDDDGDHAAADAGAIDMGVHLIARDEDVSV